jgi:predicted AAA+ superfamily ATPase
MIERGEHFGFTLETPDAISITREFVRQYFDRDFTLQLRIAGTIDLTL